MAPQALPRRGIAGEDWHGPVRSGNGRRVAVAQARVGAARSGSVGPDDVTQAWLAMVTQGEVG